MFFKTTKQPSWEQIFRDFYTNTLDSAGISGSSGSISDSVRAFVEQDSKYPEKPTTLLLESECTTIEYDYGDITSQDIDISDLTK